MLLITLAVGRIQVSTPSGVVVGLHGGEWRIFASAVDESLVIEDALSWLSGGECEVIVQKEASTLGAPMQTIIVKLGSKQALLSLGMLDKESIRLMLNSGLGSRIDDDKFLHVRLSLAHLVRGRGILAHNSEDPVAKGKFKLEVYPGQIPIDVAENVLEGLIEN